jgi:hypothetical protein
MLDETEKHVTGDLDDVAIYGRALSGDELAQPLRKIIALPVKSARAPRLNAASAAMQPIAAIAAAPPMKSCNG